MNVAKVDKKVDEPKVLTGTYGMVLYTDGGCRPASRGFAGWGVHGYLYNTEESKRGSGCRKGYPTPTGYEAEKKKELTMLSYFDGIGSIEGESTNQEAELVGMLKAIQKVLEVNAVTKLTKVVFYCDSKYVIDGLTQWVTGWIKNGWTKSDGSEITHVGVWRRLDELRNECKEAIPDVTWKWVKGHNGNLGNECSDELATKGVVLCMKGDHVDEWTQSEAQGYWNYNVAYNRLLAHPRWYFNTNSEKNTDPVTGRTIYYLGDNGNEDSPGKRGADCCFSIVHLKEPDAVLEAIRDEQNRVSPSSTIQQVVQGRLADIFQSRVLHDLRKSLSRFIHTTKNGPNRNLTLTNTPLTDVCDPPLRVWNAVETLGTLGMILDSYLGYNNLVEVTSTDITDILYEVDRTKKQPTCKLRPEINSSTSTFDIHPKYSVKAGEVGTTMVRMILGLDIAKRNDLAAIASRFPTVKVITWKESECAFRYATIIEAGDDLGLYCAAYANIRVLI